MALSGIKVYDYQLANVQQLGGMDVVALNYMQNPFNVNIVANIISGAANFGIEFTTDDLSGDPTLFRWLPLTGLNYGQTATVQYTLTYPVTAVRINFAQLAGWVRFTVLQGSNAS